MYEVRAVDGRIFNPFRYVGFKLIPVTRDFLLNPRLIQHNANPALRVSEALGYVGVPQSEGVHPSDCGPAFADSRTRCIRILR